MASQTIKDGGRDNTRRRFSMSKNSGNESRMGAGIGIGIAIGAAIGVATDNIAIGIGVGLAIGAGIGAAWDKRRSRDDGTG
jgi:hypothetical protein